MSAIGNSTSQKLLLGLDCKMKNRKCVDNLQLEWTDANGPKRFLNANSQTGEVELVTKENLHVSWCRFGNLLICLGAEPQEDPPIPSKRVLYYSTTEKTVKLAQFGLPYKGDVDLSKCQATTELLWNIEALGNSKFKVSTLKNKTPLTINGLTAQNWKASPSDRSQPQDSIYGMLDYLLSTFPKKLKASDNTRWEKPLPEYDPNKPFDPLSLDDYYYQPKKISNVIINLFGAMGFMNALLALDSDKMDELQNKARHSIINLGELKDELAKTSESIKDQYKNINDKINSIKKEIEKQKNLINNTNNEIKKRAEEIKNENEKKKKAKWAWLAGPIVGITVNKIIDSQADARIKDLTSQAKAEEKRMNELINQYNACLKNINSFAKEGSMLNGKLEMVDRATDTTRQAVKETAASLVSLSSESELISNTHTTLYKNITIIRSCEEIDKNRINGIIKDVEKINKFDFQSIPETKKNFYKSMQDVSQKQREVKKAFLPIEHHHPYFDFAD